MTEGRRPQYEPQYVPYFASVTVESDYTTVERVSLNLPLPLLETMTDRARLHRVSATGYTSIMLKYAIKLLDEGIANGSKLYTKLPDEAEMHEVDFAEDTTSMPSREPRTETQRKTMNLQKRLVQKMRERALMHEIPHSEYVKKFLGKAIDTFDLHTEVGGKIYQKKPNDDEPTELIIWDFSPAVLVQSAA